MISTYFLTCLRQGYTDIVTEKKNQFTTEKNNTTRFVVRSIESGHSFWIWCDDEQSKDWNSEYGVITRVTVNLLLAISRLIKIADAEADESQSVLKTIESNCDERFSMSSIPTIESECIFPRVLNLIINIATFIWIVFGTVSCWLFELINTRQWKLKW